MTGHRELYDGEHEAGRDPRRDLTITARLVAVAEA